MDIQLNKEIKTIDGKKILVNDENATVGNMSYISLMNSSSDKYLEKVDLAKRIRNCEDDVISLKSEEVTLIKNTVKEMRYTAQTVYQFEKAIDLVEEDKEDKDTKKKKKSKKDE